ncbi:MAG TPA: DUF488 domain-containing protein [Xanthobacteraceae bacterium]|nr:DUF488 domain-containing protein [Xanthobacteraceae bacterium]
MPAFDLFSIGHSNIPADRFLATLQNAGVNAIADVRSTPFSRFFPWFSQQALAARLAAASMTYTFMGGTLGGRPRDERLYRDGIADYAAMATQAEFHDGLQSLIDAMAQSRICLLCAEREPLDCHRCLLVTRHLAESGLTVGHILHDGTIEPHAATERRLLALYDDDCDLFEAGQASRLAAAYRWRAKAAAFRQKSSASRRAAEKR